MWSKSKRSTLKKIGVKGLDCLLLFSFCICQGCTKTPKNNSLTDPNGLSTSYLILGLLDEYSGHSVPPKMPEFIESFYASETKASEVFEKHLEIIRHEYGINTNIKREISDGGHIQFYNVQLANLINSFYKSSKREGISGPVFFISKDKFTLATRGEKLSYLAGAYCRYGDGNAFHFANAENKIEVIVNLLKEFGCSDVNFSTSPPDYIPTSFTITFQPTAETNDWFSRFATQ
jgi:hypothetical protein